MAEMKETKSDAIQPAVVDYHPRFDQQRIEATAIKAHARSEASILSSTIVQGNNSPGISNGQQTTFTITFSVPDATLNFRCLIQPEISLYVDSVAAANQLPSGSAIDETQWQVIGPWMDVDASDGRNMVMKLYILNISAGASKLLILRVRARGISQTDSETTA